MYLISTENITHTVSSMMSLDKCCLLWYWVSASLDIHTIPVKHIKGILFWVHLEGQLVQPCKVYLQHLHSSKFIPKYYSFQWKKDRDRWTDRTKYHAPILTPVAIDNLHGINNDKIGRWIMHLLWPWPHNIV